MCSNDDDDDDDVWCNPYLSSADGFRNMVVGFVTMPTMNNVEIYKELFCAIVINSNYGLWDQLRVDQGKEWKLTLFAQELCISPPLCTSQTRAPHLQTFSKQVF